VAVGLCLDEERLRVWEKAVAGARRIKNSKVVATSFKVCVSSSAVLNSDREFPGGGVIVPKTKAAVRMTPEHHDLVA
jgi:hypothetical protein